MAGNSEKPRRLIPGKLPADLLAKWLGKRQEGPVENGIVIGPGTGEDTAVIDPSGEHDLLVVTSDPITFTTIDMGEYAVMVSANDIATSGGVPHWFFATVLLPPGIESTEAETLLDEISTACGKRGITLSGGHTEITDAVTRPVISGTLVGTVSRKHVVDKRLMSPGDVVFVTKQVAIEGTLILATGYADRLGESGFSMSELEIAAKLKEKIDVRNEAQIAVNNGGVTAMHDVTEGGIATALSELGVFGRLQIDLDAIPILPVCRRMCNALSIDPLGLIGSGSLLIACEKPRIDALQKSLNNGGITWTVIGEVVAGAPGVEWHRSGSSVLAPTFEVDEIARIS